MKLSPVLLLPLAIAAAVPRQATEVALAKPNTDPGLAPQVENFVKGSGPIITGEGAGGISKRGFEAATAKTNTDPGLAAQVEKFMAGSGPIITGEGAGGISK